MFRFDEHAVLVSSDQLERPVAIPVVDIEGVNYFQVHQTDELNEILLAGVDRLKKSMYRNMRKVRVFASLKKLKDDKYKELLHGKHRLRGAALRAAKLQLSETCTIEAPSEGDIEGIQMKCEASN
jgi:hypothetical protein